MARMTSVMIAILSFSFSASVLAQQGGGPGAAAKALYAGSESCGVCHEGEYNYWRITPHASMARVPDWEKSKLLRQLASEGLPFSKQKVALVLGNLKVLVFLTRQGKDFMAMPRQYNMHMKRWEDFTEEEWEPRLDGSGEPAEAGPVNWNKRCAGCHTTGYDPATGKYVELSVGCEECHGPGATHVRTEKKDDIINPRSLPREQGISICGQCHSRGVSKDGGHPFPATFVPGDLLSDHFNVLEPEPGVNTEAFWGNGMARRHHQQCQEFAQSAHSRVGLSCLDCHEGHRFKLKSPPKGSKALWGRTEMALLAHQAHSVCLRCHTAAERDFVDVVKIPEGMKAPQIQSIDVHSRHPLVLDKKRTASGKPVKSKLLCNDCHMPMTAPEKFGYPMHTHTFRTPDPKDTVRYGVPNACNHCHSDKTPAWAREQYLAMWVLNEGAPDALPRFLASFEDAGRHTTWTTWVEIHKAISDGTYRVDPKHDISELERMGLITKKLTLK